MKYATNKIASALVQIKGATEKMKKCREILIAYLAALEARPATKWRLEKAEKVRDEIAQLETNLATLDSVIYPQ